MKVIVEREYKIVRQGICEVSDLNKDTMEKIADLYIMEQDPVYLEETRQSAGPTKIYSEDKSLLLYQSK